MKHFFNIIGTFLAIAYFIIFMLFLILVLMIWPLVFIIDVSTILKSGFGVPNNVQIIAVSLSCFIFSFSLLIPWLRRIYSILPWLFPFTQMLLINNLILGLGFSILNYGYQTVNPTKHIVFFVLMIVFIIIARLGMCYYYKRRPFIKGNNVEVNENE